MNHHLNQSSLLRYLVLSLSLLIAHPLSAEDGGESVHWAYSAFLGTGWYKLDRDRKVYVLRIPPRWYFRESSSQESGFRKLGVEFHFPLTLGLHKLENVGDFLDFDNIGTVSLNPGVEFEYPVNEHWYLRAYGHLGWGKESQTHESAWIYDAGLKSRYSLQAGKLDWGILNEIFIAGYDATSDGDDKLSGMLAGIDFSYPIGSGNSFKLNWDLSYRWYENDLSFPQTNAADVTIEDEWEIGLALARQNAPIKLWFLEFEHVGLVYRFNTDGGFRAITVNFRSPFTR